MDNREVQALIQKYQDGKSSHEEQMLLENWYARESYRQMQHPESEDYPIIQKEIWESIQLNLPVRKIRLWPKIAFAAAAVAVLVFGTLFFILRSAPGLSPKSIAYQNDVLPGGLGATITLSNGQKIKLNGKKNGLVAASGAALKYEDGSELRSVTDSHSTNYTAETAKAQTYIFTLPDGTKVWLNAASSLKFPAQFSGQKRVVELIGEGYFEVAKNKARPFIVKGPGQEIKVLGTHFNVNTYDDDPICKTTLLEGSVQISHDGKVVKLFPGQKSLISKNSIQVITADTDDEIDWVKGDFVFKAESLQTIMKEIARWYDVDVYYAGGVDSNMILGGFVSRSKNISAVLKMMELTKMVRFNIQGKKITVLPNNN
ncbi:FecR domain-containing protein [Pedobacter sp. ISL-68]|uniref:FecR family protein n=1 Tax=unclassified Pedobacter TaxID=2628915 RepID=UPI001BE97C23|nr:MULTISPECIES: FecR family protein [unclassified Pedobacter]MBT2560197.1 FecR domain-containing protein [Pedobacter sp. ISL-64]MBT2589176.1 FecR domain-containing protein [Pedobacter sp. ISL-68]